MTPGKNTAKALLALQLLPFGAAQGQQNAIAAASASEARISLSDNPVEALWARAEQEPLFEKAIAPLFAPKSTPEEKGHALKAALDALPPGRNIRANFLAALQLKTRENLKAGGRGAMEMIELIMREGKKLDLQEDLREQKNELGQNMMFDAVFSGNPGNIVRMKALEIDADTRDSAGKSPLSYGLKYPAMIDELLGAHAPAESPYTEDGTETQLFIALKKGYFESANRLIEGHQVEKDKKGKDVAKNTGDDANGNTGEGTDSKQPAAENKARIDAIVDGEPLAVALLKLDKSVCDSVRKIRGLRLLLDSGMDPNTKAADGRHIMVVAADLKDDPSITQDDTLDPGKLAVATLLIHNADPDALTDNTQPNTYGDQPLLPAFTGYERTIAITGADSFDDASDNPAEFFKYAVAAGLRDQLMQELMQVPAVNDWISQNRDEALVYAKDFDPDGVYKQLSTSGVPPLRPDGDMPGDAPAAANINAASGSSTADTPADNAPQQTVSIDVTGSSPGADTVADNTPQQPVSADNTNSIPVYEAQAQRMWSQSADPDHELPGAPQDDTAVSTTPKENGRLGSATPDALQSLADKTDSWPAAEPQAPPRSDTQQNDPFYQAVRHDDVDAFRRLIESGEDTGRTYTINRESGITGNLSHLVAEYADREAAVEMMKMLKGRIAPGQPASNGQNEVNFAAGNDNDQLISYLAHCNVPLNASEQHLGIQIGDGVHGYNALDAATDGVNYKALDALLKNGIVGELAEAEVRRSIRHAREMNREEMAGKIEEALNASRRIGRSAPDAVSAVR